MPFWRGHEELPVGIRCTRSGAPFCSAIAAVKPERGRRDATRSRVGCTSTERRVGARSAQGRSGSARAPSRSGALDTDPPRYGSSVYRRRWFNRSRSREQASGGHGRSATRERAEAVPAFLCAWRALGSDTDSARLSLDGLERSGYAARIRSVVRAKNVAIRSSGGRTSSFCGRSSPAEHLIVAGPTRRRLATGSLG